ncbi:MAG: TfoX/Sxy family protein [Pseudomonadales bacterium]
MLSQSHDQSFVASVVDLMQSVGPVSARRMFGGHGLFLDGLMIALVSQGTLYLKTDQSSAAEFFDLGLESFTYTRKGKICSLSYVQAPEEVLDNTEEMLEWGNKAYSAALRAASKKRKKG